MDERKSSLSGVQGIETRVRDVVSQCVLKALDELAGEGLALLLELKEIHDLAPGNPARTTIVTRMIGFHTRADR